MRSAVVRSCVEELLEETQLSVATDERGLQPFRLPPSGPAGDHAQSAPQRHWLGLALHLVDAGVLVRDRSLGRSSGRLADDDGSRRGRTLRAGCRVREIARDHSLTHGSEIHRRLAREDGSPCREGRDPGLAPELAHRVDELERRTDRPLGIVLLGNRRSPDCHHRVADELLDLTAVATDHRGRRVEVARKELTHVFRVSGLREGREADQVGEEHRYEPALDDDALGSSGCRSAAELSPALAAEPLAGLVRGPAARTRHSQRSAALGAELPPCPIRRAARRARLSRHENGE